MDLERALTGLTSEHQHERDAAVEWLLRHGPEGLPRLRAMAQGRQGPQSTLAAIRLLGVLGTEPDVTLLEGLLRGPDERFRWEAAKAIGRLGYPGALQALVAAVGSADPSVAGAAAAGLGGRTEPEARAALEGLLRHPDEGVRHGAVHALARLGVRPSAQVLREHASREPSGEIRRLVEKLLTEGER